MTAPPATVTSRDQRGIGHHVLTAGRFVLGYILAVAVGALIFAVTAGLLLPELTPVSVTEQPDMSRAIGQTAYLYFILGLVFGIPYTILASAAFWFWLRRSTIWFWLLGTLCPAAALLLMFSMLDAIALDWTMLKLLLATLPAGLAATYVYGAIGFGQGFGRWRFG